MKSSISIYLEKNFSILRGCFRVNILGKVLYFCMDEFYVKYVLK